MAIVAIERVFVDLLTALGLDASKVTSFTLRYDARHRPELAVTFLEDDPERLGNLVQVLKSFTLVPNEEG